MNNLDNKINYILGRALMFYVIFVFNIFIINIINLHLIP